MVKFNVVPIPRLYMLQIKINFRLKFLDYYTFLGNCPPTPPLSQHFTLSEKKVLMLA